MRFCKPMLFAGLGMICGASSVALLASLLSSQPETAAAPQQPAPQVAAATDTPPPKSSPAPAADPHGERADGGTHTQGDARSLTGPRTPPRPLGRPPQGQGPIQTVSLQAGDAAIAPSTSAESVSTRVVTVGRGDTLMSVLGAGGVERQDALTAVEALQGIYNPRALRVGDELTLTFAIDEDGEQSFQGFSFTPNPGVQILTSRGEDNGFSSSQMKAKLTEELVRFKGTINSSLFDAAISAGVPHSALNEFIRVFSYDVDFQRDIQKGDSFELAFNRKATANGETVEIDDLVYASMTLSGTTITLFRFKSPDGSDDFYNGKGESIRKALLRTPINGARLSSGFGSRNHPVLGYTTMHKGVDFAAPTGTPIYAAGDGVIEMASPNGSYGNYVRVRHTSEYATAYAHMSGFAKGISSGVRVRQGDVIGYVGSTGRSTGPHLHYEILQGGRQVNPMGVRFPTGRKLAGADLKKFEAARAGMEKTLAGLPNGIPSRTAKR